MSSEGDGHRAGILYSGVRQIHPYNFKGLSVNDSDSKDLE